MKIHSREESTDGAGNLVIEYLIEGLLKNRSDLSLFINITEEYWHLEDTNGCSCYGTETIALGDGVSDFQEFLRAMETYILPLLRRHLPGSSVLTEDTDG